VPLHASAAPDAAVLRLAVITAVPVAVFAGLGLVVRYLTGQWRPHRWRWEAAAAVPVHRPIELVAADLRRLGRELALVPSGTAVARRRGLLAAYDDVLCEAAAALDLSEHLTAASPAARELERLRLLAALEAAGLVTG
jgi:hypothetical protein